MARAYLVLLVLILAVGCVSSELIEHGQYHVIPFRLSDAKIPIVRATLNDKAAWFIVDSGASATLINSAVAKHFGISERFNFYESRTEINGLGGTAAFESSFCKIEIGNLVIHHPVLKSRELNGLFQLISSREKLPITGILGSDILLQCGISLNYENKTLMYKVKGVTDAVVAN